MNKLMVVGIFLIIAGFSYVGNNAYNEHQDKVKAEIAANIEKHKRNYWYVNHLAGD